MARQTKVGLLVLTALVILVVTALSLGQGQHFWERKVQYEIHLARTNGLQEGAQVSLSGVPIGSVTALRLPSDLNLGYIVVTLKVSSEAAPRIRDNTLASVRTFGLLGDRYIELTPGSPQGKPIEPGGVITSIDPVDYEAVLGQSGDIVTNVLEVTASLKEVLGAIQRGEGLLGAMIRKTEFGEQTLRDLERTLVNVQDTSNALAQIVRRVDHGEGLLGHLVRNTKESRDLVARLDRSSKSLDEFTTRLNRSRGTLGRLVDDDEYAKRVLGNIDHASRDLSEVAAKINRGDGTLGRLVNDPTLYEQTQALVGSAQKSWLLRLLRGSSPSSTPTTAPQPAGALR